MEDALVYILKFSITIAVLTLLYITVLRRLTFYRWNRFYLLTVVLIAFVLPLVDVTTLWAGYSKERPALQVVPAVDDISFILAQQNDSADRVAIAIGVLLSGSAVLLFRLLAQYISLVSLRRNSVLVHKEPGLKVFDPCRALAPFSFGNSIFINRAMYPDHELQKITQHELVHVLEHHSIDLLLSEIVCILNWYNPFAWLLRKCIRQNLEFIADEVVLSKGSDPKEYQYLLLKSSGISPFMLVNTFSMQNLKNRIVMMNRSKSTTTQLLKFLVIVPVLLFTTVLCRRQVDVPRSEGPTTARSESRVQVKIDHGQYQPLYFVDGVKQPSDFNVQSLKPEEISSISVWKGESAIEKFGSEATNGVIEISMNKKQ